MMLFNVFAFVFALSLLTLAVAAVVVLVSFVLRRIQRKIALWTMAGAAALCVLTVIGAGVTEPPSRRTPAPRPADRVGQSRVSTKPLSSRTAKPSTADAPYFGDPPALLGKQFQLSAADVRLVTEVQGLCAIAQRDDEETRHAKDSMGVAMALERVAGEWEVCDNAIGHATQNRALRNHSDYDYVRFFGLIPSNALLQESGAYGSAGSEWVNFGQYGRAIEDYQHAVDVGRTMVSRGFTDEGKTVISDNKSALNDLRARAQGAD